MRHPLRLCLALSLLAILGNISLAFPQCQGFAVALNGVDAYGTALGTDAVANSTWEAWVRIPQFDPSTPGLRPILSRWGMWTHWSPIVDSSNGAAQGAEGFGCGAGGPSDPAGTVPEGQWHHLATVFGPGSSPGWDFYVDGQFQNFSPGGCQVPFAGWELDLGVVGYIGYSGFVNAQIDEARISSIPRYTGPFVPEHRFTPDANTIALWHFDEGSGSQASDSSGNGHDFSLHGGYSWVAGVDAGPATYCTAKVNSLGCTPAIGYTGLPSISSGPDNFYVTATNVLNNKNGIMLWGGALANTPFYGGTLCIAPPIVRTPVQNSGGNPPPDDCSGTYSFHFSQAYMANQFLVAGNTVYAQYWSRDPGFNPPNNIGLTNGLRFTICP